MTTGLSLLKRSESLINVHAHLTTIQLNGNNDYYEWEIDGKVSSLYSTRTIYEKLCGEGTSVPWFGTVWNKSGIPRHNFLSWMFVLNQCPTRDRTIRWGHQISPSCLLCNQSPKLRDHLFFMCHYSWNLWGLLAPRCGIQPERSWDLVLNQIQSTGRNSIKGILTRLCWQGCIDWTWRERNARLHRQVFRSTDSIAR